MSGRRTSARQAAKAATHPAAPQESESLQAGSKRKAKAIPDGQAKKGKTTGHKDQSTIESTLPLEKSDRSKDEDNGDRVAGDAGDGQAKAEPGHDGGNGRDDTRKEEHQGTNGVQKDETSKEGIKNGFSEIMNKDSKQETGTPEGTGSKVSPEDDAVNISSEREASQPSNVLEKGIIYFFFRGRVGINEPDSVGDVARSYIILRPLEDGAKLGEGPIGDPGHNRILALPKKVLPKSPRDRFLTFVAKANVSMDDIKDQLASSDYSTKTTGVRHTPAATPIGEGVYAFTQTGRETHLAYIITIPGELGDVQKDVGLRQRGSYLTSAKNPQSSGPANAQLPQGAEYPPKIQEEFGGRGWMPLQPKLLDYENTQFLLIGHGDQPLEKATKPPNGQEEDDSKVTPLEEVEKLEEEDEHRTEGLGSDHAIFADLGLSSKEYPKVQTTW